MKSAARSVGAGDAARPRRTAVKSAVRVPRGSISREQIVATATRIIAAGGFDEMTVRSLAQELGVGPMSLYRHVKDKDDLLSEVVDRLLAQIWRPAVSEGNWRAFLTESADIFRAFLVEQPAALHVYLRHPVVTPAALERMTAMVRTLRSAQCTEQRARRGYAALHTYTIGFAALQAARGQAQPSAESDAADLAYELAGYASPHQFVDGLGYLLAGIEDAGT